MHKTTRPHKFTRRPKEVNGPEIEEEGKGKNRKQMKKRVNSKENSSQGDRVREREMMKKKGKTEPKGFSIIEQSHGSIRVEYCRFAIYKCKKFSQLSN